MMVIEQQVEVCTNIEALKQRIDKKIAYILSLLTNPKGSLNTTAKRITTTADESFKSNQSITKITNQSHVMCRKAEAMLDDFFGILPPLQVSQRNRNNKGVLTWRPTQDTPGSPTIQRHRGSLSEAPSLDRESRQHSRQRRGRVSRQDSKPSSKEKGELARGGIAVGSELMGKLSSQIDKMANKKREEYEDQYVIRVNVIKRIVKIHETVRRRTTTIS